MHTLDYCRVMAQIEAKPTDKVILTVGQFLQLRQHVLGCEVCKGRMDRMLAQDATPPQIGPRKEAN